MPTMAIDFSNKQCQPRQGYFFIVSGPSGVGKNTLLNEALKQIQDVFYLPSITTREMREGESQGKPYFFVSNDEFEAMIAAGQFLEWKKIHSGSYYGTHFPTIEFAIERGYDIVTDMDVLGCAEVVQKFPRNIVTIFIEPPDLEELYRRLCRRDDNPTNIKARMERVEMEMSYAPDYRHLILNDDLKKASKQLVEIIRHHVRNNN